MDTRPFIEQLQTEGLRQMPSRRKMELLRDMNETVRTLALQRGPALT